MLNAIENKYHVYGILLAIMVTIYGLGLAPAMAASEIGSKSAVIHFANRDGIKEWRPEGTTSILIQGVNGQWHRADFFAQCFELPWSERVAFLANPNGNLDKFSSILVGREKCHFKNLEKVPDPDDK